MTDDGVIGRSVPNVAAPPVRINPSPRSEGSIPTDAAGEPLVEPLCSAGGLGLSFTPDDFANGNEPTISVDVEVPAGLNVEGDFFRSRGPYDGRVTIERINGDGTTTSAGVFPTSQLLGDRTIVQTAFTASTTATYRMKLRIAWTMRSDTASVHFGNVRFVDGNGDFVADPCAGLEQITQCLASGGGVYISPGGLSQTRDGQTLGPGCYAVETCATSPFVAAVTDWVAKFLCQNDPILDVAQDVAIATAVVLGMIVVVPVVAAGAGVQGGIATTAGAAKLVLAGAGINGVIGFWACDQSDNSGLAPSLDQDTSCLATEIALGAVLSPLALVGGGQIVPRVAVVCVGGAVDGAASATAHMVFVEEDQAFDAANALVGGGIGCVTAGVLDSAFNRVFRSADGVRERGVVSGLPGPSGVRRPYEVDSLKGQFFEYSCGAASCAMVGGGPEAYWRQAARTTTEGTRLSDAADALTEAGFASVYRENISIDELFLATKRRPAIVAGNGHDVVVDRILGNDVYIRDPYPIGIGESYVVTVAEFIAWWDGREVVGA